VVVEGKRVNAHVVVKMCAIGAVVARMDTLLGALDPLAAADDSTDAARAAESAVYDHLVSQLRAGDTVVDYTALRMAYTKTANYKPYPVRWEGNHAMLAALERRHFAGRTIVHVHSETPPGPEFAPVEPDLKDVYFTAMAGRNALRRAQVDAREAA
jgi:hypothetical protein